MGSVARLREAPPPFAALIAANEDWIREAPRGTFNGNSFHWKTAPVWKWYLGHERIHRGLPSPGVDFARFDSPHVAAIDDAAGIPDDGFAAAMAEFSGAQPVGGAVEHDGARWYFVARDEAARRALGQ